MLFTKTFNFYWMPVIFWALIIFTVSTMPGEIVDDVAGAGEVFDYSFFAHFFEFVVFSFLLFRAVSSDERVESRRVFVVVIGVCLVFSFVTEFMQIYVPGRFFDFSDIVVNSLGAIAGLGRYVLAS